MAGATRQKILDEAEKLLLLKGLARVTTKEIARETGLSEGALYLLGPCFQWVFNRLFLGADPFHKTEQQFAEELVQGLTSSILPS